MYRKHSRNSMMTDVIVEVTWCCIFAAFLNLPSWHASNKWAGVGVVRKCEKTWAKGNRQ